ncbi:MAG: hypothetical protein ACR2F8_14500 [Caulobacteraceae bacterium]
MAREAAKDSGYALVAAIAAMAAFAYIAFEVLAADRGQIVGVGARIEQARLEAAADAGLTIAIHGLGDPDPDRRWPIDGSVRRIGFDGADLAVAIQDERGKVPIDGVNATQARALFENAGATGPRLDALVAELSDFQFGDESADPTAPPAPGPAGAYGAVRHGGFRTVGDLMALKDMDVGLFERVAPAVTVFFEESGPFEPNNAGPLARLAMAAEDAGPSPDLLAQANADDEPQVEPITPDVNLIGRTVTVQAVAFDRRGARAHRTAIVELTGVQGQPYWIRYVE